MKTQKSDFIIDANVLTMILINLMFFKNMNIWIIGKIFNETPLPKNVDFYSHLNMEGITNANYVHAKRVCKSFEMKN